jgi:hypothetical protein
MGRSREFGWATGVVAACALASLLVPASASARNTTGFHVYNLSGSSLKLTTFVVDPGFDESKNAPIPPEEGDVLKPGLDKTDDADHNNFEVRYRTLYRNSAVLKYKGPRGVFHVILEDSECSDCRYKPRAYCVEESGYQCQTEGTTVFILDPPGTVNRVTADHPGDQAEILREICTEKNVAAKDLVKCKFKPTKRIRDAFGNPHVVGGVRRNCTDHEIEHGIVDGDTVGTSNSLGIKLGFETKINIFGQEVKSSLETEYEHEWTTEHKFQTDDRGPISARHIGWWEAITPVIRDIGDFTLEIGNTTWILRDVSFDSPDPTREGEVEWSAREEKMSDREFAENCRRPPPSGPGVRNAPASEATLALRGTNSADALVGGAESTTVIARAGSDIVRGGSGDDELLGGPGADLLSGGRGSDTIVDSQGRTSVSTGGAGRDGPDFVDVRDGDGDDRVICGSGDTTVRADRGDRLRRCGG